MDWRGIEAALVDYFRSEGWRPEKTDGLSARFAGDWILTRPEEDEEEMISLTDLARTLAAHIEERNGARTPAAMAEKNHTVTR